MDRFRHIFFLERHLEGSCRACTTAVELARANDARLTVAAVVRRDVELWQARLAEVARWAAERGVEVDTRLLGGDTRTAVVREIERAGHDLFMAVALASSLPSLAPGHPEDRALVRTLPCAAWFLAPSQGGPVRVVLAAVRLATPEPSALDRRILEVAASLAERTGARLEVVHFWGLLGESVLSSPTRGVRRGRLRRVLTGLEVEQTRRLEELVAEVAPTLDARVVVAKGDASRGVAEVARRHQADVVVAGNSGRSGFEGVLFGNLTERLLGRVHGSVLAVRSDDPGRPSTVPAPRGGVRRSGLGSAAGRPAQAGQADGAGRAGGGVGSDAGGHA